MLKRMAVALISVLGIVVATYLTLHKLGYIGSLACQVGSCDQVNATRYAIFVGAPVAAWGIAFYITLFAVAVASIQPRFADSRTPSVVLVALTGWGVLFSSWLTYLELFVIKAICQWCVLSAILVTIMFAISLWDLKTRPQVAA